MMICLSDRIETLPGGETRRVKEFLKPTGLVHPNGLNYWRHIRQETIPQKALDYNAEQRNAYSPGAAIRAKGAKGVSIGSAPLAAIPGGFDALTDKAAMSRFWNDSDNRKFRTSTFNV